MKRTISMLMIATVLFVIETKAQDSKPTFGIRFGGHLTKITGKDSQGNPLEQDLKLGAGIGVNIELPIAPNFYFQPGLLFSNKGSKITEIRNATTVTSTAYITYVEVPLNVMYKPQLGTGNLLIGIGPYIAYGIIGQVREKPGSSEKIKFKNTVASTDPVGNYLKPLDVGASMLIGYQFKTRFLVQLNAQRGFIGIHPKFEDRPDDKSSYKNAGFGISIGYRFYPRK